MAIDSGIPQSDLRQDAAGQRLFGNADNAAVLDSVAKGIENSTYNRKFKLFDGPLAALENNGTEFVNRLTYPQDLGNNNQYRYVMRMLIFKQRRGVSQPVITPNSLDRSYRAAQGGRLNTDVINFGSGAAIGAAAATTIATNIISEFAPTKLIGKAAGAVGGAFSTALETTAALATASGLEDFDTKVETEPLSYINLYMPDGLNFVDRHDYDAVSVTDALGNLGALGTGSLTEIAARVGENARIGGFSLLGQNITDLALYNTGYALNPQLQVLFKGSKNREFVFTFKFIPRNAYEALTIESIIRTLRYHAAPNYDTTINSDNFGAGAEATRSTNNSRYFIPPSQFEIEFLVMTQGAAVYNDKLPRIAQCVLTNVDVNYAPSGQFAAYQDFQPVETQLQLTFTETVVLTKPDIQVGY